MIQKASEGCVSMGRVFQSLNPGEGSIAMRLHLRGKEAGLKGRSGTLPTSPPRATPSGSALCV